MQVLEMPTVKIPSQEIESWASFHFYSKLWEGESIYEVVSIPQTGCYRVGERFKASSLEFFVECEVKKLEQPLFEIFRHDTYGYRIANHGVWSFNGNFYVTQEEVSQCYEQNFREEFTIWHDYDRQMALIRNRHPFATYLLRRFHRVLNYENEGCCFTINCVHEFCGTSQGAYAHWVPTHKYDKTAHTQTYRFYEEIMEVKYKRLGRSKWEQAVGKTWEQVEKEYFS